VITNQRLDQNTPLRKETSSPTATVEHSTPGFARWLTTRRLQRQGLLLAICIWGVVAVDFATPSLVDRAGNIKFQDFLPYYVSGLLASQHRSADLYNTQLTSQLMRDIVPESASFNLPILYGPQVAVFFEPFAAMPFLSSALVWIVLSTIFYSLCCYTVLRCCPRLRGSPRLVVLLAIAFPPLFHTLVRGQNSAVALLLFVAAFSAFSINRRFLAGLALGMLVFKPQLAIAAVVVMLVSGEGKVLIGFATSAVAQLALAWFSAGTVTLRTYLNLLWHFRTLASSIESSLADAHCLRTFWDMLLPWPNVSLALYAITAAFVLAIATLTWKSTAQFSLRFSSLLLATILVSPHLYVYDLLILAPAFFLLTNWLLDHPAHPRSGQLMLLLYLAYLSTLAAPITKFTHVQLSVPIFVAIQWDLFRILREEDTHTASSLATAHP
jgi:Glycosyltransferase family 87